MIGFCKPTSAVAMAAAAALVPQAALALDLNIPGVGSKHVPGTPLPWYEQEYHPFGIAKATIKPSQYVAEGVCLGIALLYIVVYIVGRSRNRAIVLGWTKAALPLLRDEFAAVASEDDKDKKDEVVVWNGAGDAVVYATGRRGVESMHALFRLKSFYDPLHYLVYTVADLVMSATRPTIRDSLVLTFDLPYLSPDNVSGVFAVVDKTVLRDTRKGRFDLTFTKLADADDASAKRGIDNRFAIMSEVNEFIDVLLGEVGERGQGQRDRVGLASVLNGDGGKLLESFVITDQPFERPEVPVPVSSRKRRIIVTLRAPLNEREFKSSLAIVEAACNVIDAMELGPAKLKETTVAKLRKTRADMDKEIEEEATKDQREEEEEKRLAAKAAKRAQLSEKEQERRKELEKKRKQRKAGGLKVRGR